MRGFITLANRGGIMYTGNARRASNRSNGRVSAS